jgi:hypothetical protein
MQNSARRVFAQLLLARFIILNFFIKVAVEVLGHLQSNEHRRSWVLLQAQPGIFDKSKRDIFAELSQLLRCAEYADLEGRIKTENNQLRLTLEREILSGQEAPPVFCVVDEAQLTTCTRRGEFTSRDHQKMHPVLQPLWVLWTSVLDSDHLRLVLSGTGIEVQTIEGTSVSSVGKGYPYAIRSNDGAFDDAEVQARYIKHYIPACWTKPQWQEFLDRAWRWFRGR